MKHNLKRLGLVLIAVFAMGAVAASAVQAQGHNNVQVTSETSPWVMDGYQTEELWFTRTVTLTCETANFHAAGSDGDTTVTVTPEYEQCHARGPFGETWPATVTMNECSYLFHLFGEEKEGGGHTFTATAGVECQDEGGSITIDVYTSHSNHTSDSRLCTLHVPEQTGLTAIDLTNKAAGMLPKDSIEADIEVSGIHSSRTGSFLCGPTTDETGELHGAVALVGTDSNKNENGLTISTHES